VSRFPKLDRRLIEIYPSFERVSKMGIGDVIDPYHWSTSHPDQVIPTEVQGLAESILTARKNRRPVIFFLAGHVVKHGLSKFIIDLMQKRLITGIAANGSVAIHDWELARVFRTSEDVARYLPDGHFGHWTVPGEINDEINKRFTGKQGIGELLGAAMSAHCCGREYSIIRNAHELNIPCTFHTLVGGDIIHQHPNCTEKLFAASYEDFLIFAHQVQNLDGGVFVNIGSQVTGVEVFLKALSMARNIANARDYEDKIRDITTAMADFVRLPADWRTGEAEESDPAYYYRPWKTLLIRAVADGGKSFYLEGPHTATIPLLWQSLNNK
jgi:hypothetical protein